MNNFFFIPKSPPPAPYHKQDYESDITLSWSISTINKAALKLNDIYLKLDLAKVVRHLQQMNDKRKPHFMTFCQSPQFNSQTELIDQNFEQQRERVESSLIKVNLSQSILSRELVDHNTSKVVCESRFFNEESCFMPTNKENEAKENAQHQIKNLKWRTVVTKNVLDELDDQNRILELSKDKQSSKIINTSIDDYGQQIKILKKCLRQITTKLIESCKLDITSPHEHMRAKQLEYYCKQLCQRDLKPIDTIEQIQEINSNLKESHETCELLKQDLNAKQDEVKKYEMLLYIKNEEIASLAAIKSDLENQLKRYQEIEPKSPRRTYKKYFQNLGNDLSSTVG